MFTFFQVTLITLDHLAFDRLRSTILWYYFVLLPSSWWPTFIRVENLLLDSVVGDIVVKKKDFQAEVEKK